MRIALPLLALGLALAAPARAGQAQTGASPAPAADAAAPLLAANAAFLAANARQPGVLQTASGLQYQVLTAGTGPESPTATDVALVTYKGCFINGGIFDASEQPTPLPVSGVIPGFEEALKLMKKGGKLRAWIKPELGYGSRSPDPDKMPPNSLLIFDIELVDFISTAVYEQMMAMQQAAQGTGGSAEPDTGAAAPTEGAPAEKPQPDTPKN